MNNKVKSLLVLILFSTFIFSVKGQVPNNFSFPSIIPTSPEMYGLGKFGDIPVSTYTGTPDISIPIYTIKSGSLSLPITLSYHATGIGVSEESTWVGLGWNLIAGGSISYIPVGGYDDPNLKVPWSDLQPFYTTVMNGYGVTHEDGQVLWACPRKSINQTVNDPIMYALLGGVLDPDVLSANFPGHSFKFVKSPKDDSTYVFLGQQNKCKIKIKENANHDISYNIIGEDGTIYQFDQAERHSYHYTGWYLTKIVDVTGDSITLKYKSSFVGALPSTNERVIVTKTDNGLGGDNFTSERDPSGMTFDTQFYLDEIETKNELIKFESDTNRIDMDGALVLNRIVVKDKFNQSDKFIYRLKYSYFIGNSVGGNSFIDNGATVTLPTELFSHRLKLDSLKIGDNALNNFYVFNYYDNIALPKKTSFAMDYWGNYNGQENGNSFIAGFGHSIIPNIFALQIATQDWYSSRILPALISNGANRGASKDYITAGMLKSIQYPTKGKTVFEYEPHDFSNARYLSAEDLISITNYFSSIPDTVLFNANAYSSYNYIGGGVRIKKITNFDENNKLVLQKRYSYVNTDGKTSGRLLIPNRYSDIRSLIVGSYSGISPRLNGYSLWILSGNSNFHLFPYSSGNNVGYDRVIVESYKGSANDGKEISYYSNIAAILYAEKIPFFAGPVNGNLLKKYMLTNNGDTVLAEKYDYSYLDGIETSDLAGAYAEDQYSGPNSCNDYAFSAYNDFANAIDENGLYRFKIYSYPIRNYRSDLTRKETTHYLSDGKIKEVTDFTYNVNNFSVKSTRESKSENLKFKYKDIKYPVDYPANDTLVAMVQRNQINLPVEISEYEDSVNKLNTITHYKLWNNSFYAPWKIKTKTGSYAADERIVYDRYDLNGNLVEAHKSGNIRESYFYGYNSSFPIIKGENIDYETLNTRIQQSLPSGYSVDNLLKTNVSLPNSVWSTFNNNLRQNSPNILISTYTYDPVFGMTSTTDANNETTYYEYDSLGRLKLVRDNNYNILKKYEYNFKQ
jgi:YD repeat-containing protein